MRARAGAFCARAIIQSIVRQINESLRTLSDTCVILHPSSSPSYDPKLSIRGSCMKDFWDINLQPFPFFCNKPDSEGVSSLS